MPSNLHSKKILIGITGGIAAYKILELLRRLTEQQAQVKVILTAAGREFVTPLSIQAITGNKVFETLLDASNELAMSHIDLARWADVILIAPATANFVAKCSHGFADDLLTTVCIATTAPILIAPAMNQQMWLNTATQHNVALLEQRGYKILGPASGSQACGEFGPGRMLEPAELLQSLIDFFSCKLFSDQHFVITAGPTREAIDPVRYLSNHSSGKMGYALAAAALNLGAKVTLISGPTALNAPKDPNLNLIAVTTAVEMHQAVLTAIQNKKTDYFIGCAAVADYYVANSATQKIKKDAAILNLELKRTPDILQAVANLPATQRPYTIGFAAETEDLIANANKKLLAKNLDMIIANSVAGQKTFNSEFTELVIINKHFNTSLPEMSKFNAAYEILKLIKDLPSR